MIFEVTKADKTYKVDDLKPFDQQTKAFQKAFDEAEKSTGDGFVSTKFDNEDITVYTLSGKILISLKEVEDEDN